MKSIWIELVSKYSLDMILILNLYEIIEKRYGSSNRHYHDLDHINLMLSEAKKFKNRIDDYDSVLFAIWFHDIIYDPLQYNNLEIITDQGIINPEVILLLKTIFKKGQDFNNLERLIADVACFTMGGFSIDRKVNLRTDFHENSIEKTKENIETLRIVKVIGPSMYGLLEPGAEVPFRLMPVGTKYEKGDIIVFDRDGVKIVHRIEDTYMFNGEMFYVTEGVNPETNLYVDKTPVSE